MQANNQKPIIGIDIGGVIIGRSDNDKDTSFFGQNFLASPAVPEALATIARLARERFKVYLISKCGPATEEKTRKWLKHHRFYEITGVLPIDVRFCRERKDKAEICRKLGISHFVDDRLEVLWYMRDDVRNLYLINSVESEVRKYSQALPDVLPVRDWTELGELLLHKTPGLMTAL